MTGAVEGAAPPLRSSHVPALLLLLLDIYYLPGTTVVLLCVELLRLQLCLQLCLLLCLQLCLLLCLLLRLRLLLRLGLRLRLRRRRRLGCL